MSDIVKNLYVLSSNPFIFAEPMHAFYSLLGAKPKGLLLAYLVLPLTLHPASLNFLKNANCNSTLRTFTKKKKEGVLWGLEGRIDTWKKETNTTLRYLLDSDALVQNEDLSFDVGSFEGMGTVSSVDSVRAASRLGVIFKSHSVVDIYRELGIKELSI
jgi:hypothetical protein